MSIRFEWDRQKAEGNLWKHQVSFDEAATVFDDEFAYIFDDEDHSVDEHREIIIGRSVTEQMLLVCFTERTRDVIRIFSARPLTRKEREDYEENAHS